MTKQLFLLLLFCTHSLFANTLSDTPSPTVLEKITVLWDASYAMKSKDLTKEVAYFKAYFTENNNAQVTLVTFSDVVLGSDIFDMGAGELTKLIEKMESVIYDGYPRVPGLSSYNDSDRFFLVSTGVFLSSEVHKGFTKPVTVITSNKNADGVRLHNLAYRTKGNYINLIETDVSDAIELSKPENKTSIKLLEHSEALVNDAFVVGIVTDESAVLSNVNVRVSGTQIGTKTSPTGEYAIIAEKGDVLIFSYVGKETTKVEVTQDVINIVMISDIEDLDAVIVKAEKRDPEEDLVMTAYGVRNRNSVTTTSQTVKASDFIPHNNIERSVAGKFSGVTFEIAGEFGSMIVRKARTVSDASSPRFVSPYPLIFIDNVPMPRSTNLKIQDYSFLDPNSIVSVTVLKGLVATNKYGTEGTNGVVLIQTKVGDNPYADAVDAASKYQPPGFKKYKGKLRMSKKKYQSAFEDMLVVDGKPSYEKHLANIATNEKNSDYFFDASQLFYEAGSKVEADRIVSNTRVLFAGNTSVLRNLALIYLQRKQNHKALDVYEEMLKVSPGALQNAMDVAITAGKTNNHVKAIKAFNTIVNNTDEKYSVIEQRTGVEFRHFLKRKTQTWNLSSVKNEYFKPVVYDMRIELDWNTYDARFKVNFILPNRDMLFWGHNERENSIELSEELANGITSKQFDLDTAPKGTYFFSLEDIPENTTGIPHFLKVTIYTNYGRPNEFKMEKLMKLEPDANGEVFGQLVFQ